MHYHTAYEKTESLILHLNSLLSCRSGWQKSLKEFHDSSFFILLWILDTVSVTPPLLPLPHLSCPRAVVNSGDTTGPSFCTVVRYDLISVLVYSSGAQIRNAPLISVMSLSWRTTWKKVHSHWFSFSFFFFFKSELCCSCSRCIRFWLGCFTFLISNRAF